MLELLPETARIDGGELEIGGRSATELAEEHGTPLLVYCAQTIRNRVREYREAAPGALIVYGTKAFANVELLRLLVTEGVGADVSTLGELSFARAAGVPGEQLVFTATTSPARSCALPQRPAHLSSSTRRASRRLRRPRASSACSFG